MERIFRPLSEPVRGQTTWEERWKGPDQGLIFCWETGRLMAREDPALAKRAKNGELPAGLGWKGGVERSLKVPRKYGTLFYLAQWQGLREEPLDIDVEKGAVVTCSKTGVTVTFTGDLSKYGNA